MYRPETSYIFLLCGTGIFLVLFYIYPIVPRAPACFHSFLFAMTVARGIGPKRHLHFYSLVLEFILCYSISIQQYHTHHNSYTALVNYTLYVNLYKTLSFFLRWLRKHTKVLNMQFKKVNWWVWWLIIIMKSYLYRWTCSAKWICCYQPRTC